MNPSEEVVKKIENGEVKVKGQSKKKTVATATPATTEAQPKVKRQKVAVDVDKVLAVMKAIKAEKGKDFVITSTTLRDAFGLKNRAKARNLMKKMPSNLVRIIETTNGKRAHFTYELISDVN